MNIPIEKPDADVPENVLVACPTRAGGLVSVRPTCLACEHHRHIGILNPSEEIPWHQRHLILCGVPRKLQILEKADG